MLKTMNAGVGAHIGANLWLWTIISGLVTVALLVARNSFGNKYYLGDILALAGCVFGTFIILICERGVIRPDEIDEDEAAA